MSQITKCPGCGKELGSYEKLIDHVVEEHDTKCQLCNAKLGSREELVKHNKEKHGV